MPSRLSSLLVRDGVVAVKLLERAFQRQVIYGGSLDTNLLEMKAVGEAQLLPYASLASGVPPATRSDLEKLDPGISERCPQALARAHGVVPLAMDRDTLQILVTEPVNLGALEMFSEKLGHAVQPLLVLEYRFHVSWGRLYGLDVDSRFSKLAARLVRETAPAGPSMRPESIVIDSPAHRHQGSEPKRRPVRRRPNSQPPPSPRDTRPGVAVKAKPEPKVEPKVEPKHEPKHEPRREPPAARAEVEAHAPPAAHAPAAFAPVTPDDARFLLQSAGHRDDIFLILLRALRSQVSYAALLTVQGGSIIGRVAIADDSPLAAPIRHALIPLDVRSAFRQVVESGAPYIGPIATGDGEVDSMIERLGGCVPPAAMLLPITLRSRVVAIAFGHRGQAPLGVSEVSTILPVAGEAADALHRVIMTRKSGSRPDGATAVPEAIVDEPATSRIGPDHGHPSPQHPATANTEPARAAVTAEATTGAAPRAADTLLGFPAASDRGSRHSEPAVEPVEPVEALLTATARGDDDGVERARDRALAAPEATVSALAARFPGPLELDRHSLGNRLRPAPEHGPLLDLIVQIGGVASPLIVGELQADEPAHRYYAALCAGAVQPPAALNALVDCIFDADSGVRAAAVEALASYPQRERDGALSRVREVLTEIDEARVSAAAIACAELAHAQAIPALIEALARETAPGAIRRALVGLAKQDFGGSSRKWRAWWSKNREKSRIEWMIEGLAHKDAEVRRSAIEELRRITGEYFGYHHDLAPKERSEARHRWTRWWHETGRDRLEDAAHERRSTALLPARLRQ